MAYITEEEFTTMGYKVATGKIFADFEAIAERFINETTDYFNPLFGYHELDTDSESAIPYVIARAKAFKQAVAMQTQFLMDNDIASQSDITSNDIKQYTQGHTTVVLGSSLIDQTNASGVVINAAALIGRYGLLYKGMAHS